MYSYVPLLVMIIAGGVVAVAGLLVSAIIGPKRYNRVKVANYECGL